MKSPRGNGHLIMTVYKGSELPADKDILIMMECREKMASGSRRVLSQAR